MATTISFTDNLDGTGATATIAGSAGATNEVWVAKWSTGLVAQDWTSAGSRAGDGTLAISVPNGIHFGFVLSDSGGSVSPSNVVGFRASSGEDALHTQCCDAVRDFVLALSLDTIVEANTKVMKLPWRALGNGVGTSGVLISPLREDWEPEDNNRDSLGYRVQVSFLVAKDLQVGSSLRGVNALLMWRERFGLGVNQGGLADVLPEIHTAEIETGPVFVAEHALAHYDVSAMLVVCRTQRLRGIF